MGLDESDGSTESALLYRVTLRHKDGRPVEYFDNVCENYMDGGFLILLTKTKTIMINVECLDTIRVEEMPASDTKEVKIRGFTRAQRVARNLPSVDEIEVPEV